MRNIREMCGAHPRAARSSGASPPISTQTLTATIERLLAQRPFLIYAGLIILVPLVVIFGVSFMVMLSALVVPLLIPLVAVAGVRYLICILVLCTVSYANISI